MAARSRSIIPFSRCRRASLDQAAAGSCSGSLTVMPLRRCTSQRRPAIRCIAQTSLYNSGSVRSVSRIKPASLAACLPDTTGKWPNSVTSAPAMIAPLWSISWWPAPDCSRPIGIRSDRIIFSRSGKCRSIRASATQPISATRARMAAKSSPNIGIPRQIFSASSKSASLVWLRPSISICRTARPISAVFVRSAGRAVCQCQTRPAPPESINSTIKARSSCRTESWASQPDA